MGRTLLQNFIFAKSSRLTECGAPLTRDSGNLNGRIINPIISFIFSGKIFLGKKIEIIHQFNNIKDIKPDPEGHMAKLLIVEDEKHQRELYCMEFEDEGYEVDQAANGKDAVEMVKSNKYDLVIMDIRMPEMDGIEALGKILSRDKKIPIIIYTAYSNYKSNFMTWTADAYVTKSSNLDEIKDKVRDILATRT